MHRNRSRTPPPYLHRRRWTDADARAALADLDASGLDLTAFAAAAGLDRQRLWRWRRRLASSEATPAFEEVALVPVPPPAVEVVAPVEQCDPFEVVLVSGCLVRVPPAFDAGALSRLLAVVDRARGC